MHKNTLYKGRHHMHPVLCIKIYCIHLVLCKIHRVQLVLCIKIHNTGVRINRFSYGFNSFKLFIVTFIKRMSMSRSIIGKRGPRKMFPKKDTQVL